MALSFGVIVRPGSPYTLPASPGAAGRIHLIQISLDDGSSEGTVSVTWSAANKIPIIIARLLPGVVESLHTDLQYSLSEEVTFSVLGPRNVHLAGYFDSQQPSADSDDDFEFYENSLLKRKSRAKALAEGADQKGQDLTRNSEQINVSSEKCGSVVPDTDDEDCLLLSSPPKQSLRRNVLKEGSNRVDPERLCESGTVEGELSQNINENIHKASKSDSALELSPQQAAAESRSKKDRHVKGDPAQIVNEKKIHEVGKPDPARETALETKAKRNKQVKGERHATEEWVSEDPNANMKDEETQLDDVKYLEAGKADHALLQSDELVKDGSMRSEGKRKKHAVKGQDPAIVENDTKTTGVIGAAVEALPTTTKDESHLEKSDKSKKKRKMSEPMNNAVVLDNENGSRNVDTKPRVWTLPSGVVIEELVQGDPAGRVASPGKKLYVHYVGKLEGTDHAFASTVGNTPLKFSLGGDEAITGWSEGLEGIRVGGKRRLTIPQSMGSDPAGSRLIYEIEVLRIRG